MTLEGLQAIRDQGYTLIIDEAVSVVDVYSRLNKRELRYLKKTGMMSVDVDGFCRWEFDDEDGKLDTRYQDVKALCQTGSLRLFEDFTLIWKLHRQTIDVFQGVFILTYLFEGSILAGYLKSEGIPYTISGIQRNGGEIVPLEEVDETLLKDLIRKKLKVYDGPKNEIGAHRQKGSTKRSQKLTKTYFDRIMREEDRRAIINAVSTFVQHYAKIKSAKVAWTTFKPHRTKLVGKCYTDDTCFLPVNARATNSFAHKECLIYLANRFPKPELARYLEAEGINLDVDLWALAEMLQWIWRGCIRKCYRDAKSPDMHLFVPSERMRGLLKAWLKSNNQAELREALKDLGIWPSQSDKKT